MKWSDFFLFSWFVSEDENEHLRQENAALREMLRRREAQPWEDDDYDDPGSFNEDQYYDGREGE